METSTATSANPPQQYDRFAHPNGVLAEPARETVKVTDPLDALGPFLTASSDCCTSAVI